MFSVPQAIENSREFLLLRTDILQKTVVVCSFNISMKVLDRVFNEVIVKARHNITINRAEKSLRHVAIATKFLDDNKLKIHLKVNLHCFKVHRSYSVSFNLSNFYGV